MGMELQAIPTGTGLVTELRPPGETRSLESIMGQWLHAKGQRSQSARTVEEYRAVLLDFRTELQRAGLDLDAPDLEQLAAHLQAWVARPRSRDGRPVSPATHNRRLAIVSSFYTFGKRHGLKVVEMVWDPEHGIYHPVRKPAPNPVELVERMRVQSYAAARPLDFGDVTERLEAIDRTTPMGQRDYALLSVAQTTGRRVAELAALRWGDVTLSKGRATVTWRRTKGNKVMYNRLSVDVTDALLAWLYVAYGADLGTLPHEAPLWLALGRNAQGRRRALSTDAIADVCAKRLGVSKVHALRHTFAVALEEAGAKLTEIQEALGHSNAATTGIYMQRLHRGEDAYADDVTALFGIRGQPTPPARRGAPVTRPLGRRGQRRRTHTKG